MEFDKIDAMFIFIFFLYIYGYYKLLCFVYK